MKAEQQNWLHVMKRISAVICALAERGLSFRGDNEQFGSPNNANCLGLLELVAKFDRLFTCSYKSGIRKSLLFVKKLYATNFYISMNYAILAR